MAGHNSTSKFDTDEIRNKLEKVLADKHTFFKSAKASFKQFDKDESGTLDFDETRKLTARLCQNLQLPPVDDETLKRIFNKYDFSGDGKLQLEEFSQLYFQLLCRIRDKYYPQRKMRIRRAFFVRRTSLASQRRDINELLIFEKKLGCGSFGEVHLVRERTTNLVRVCKTINKDRSSVPVEQIEAEIEIMKSLDHPNIIKIFEVYDDYNNIYIIMEFCEGGELLKRISEIHRSGQRFTEHFVANIMGQLLKALGYIHAKKVVHKDLKPENMLFVDSSNDAEMKVIDFGLAEMFHQDDSTSHNSAGTALYMAPEVYQRNFNYKCDIWSAGVIMYFLLTGRLPFMGRTIEEVRDKVCKDQPPFQRDCRLVSPVAVDLLQKMLQKDPRVRPSASQALEHPWFQQAAHNEKELSLEIRDNIKSYMKQSALKNALVTMVAHQLNMNNEQIKQIKDLFLSFDTDRNGTLSHEELRQALGKAGVPQWDITRIIGAMDLDGTGKISYTEFVAACLTWQEQTLNLVWSAFNKMDLDGDGKITTQEFINVLTGGEAEQKLVAGQDIQEMIRQIDLDGNGLIEWDEFVAFMRGDKER